MTFKKTKLALGIAAASFSMAMVAPAQASDAKTDALEAQMKQMAAQMQVMQAELNRVKTSSAQASAETAKVQELDQWMASVKAAPASSGEKDHLVAVRGGWVTLDQDRGSSGGSNGVAPLHKGALLSNNQNNDGFYFGGAFDFNVNNDLFGLWDGTSFAVEIGVEYSQFGDAANFVSQTYTTALGAPALGATDDSVATDARLRINASPKIRFMHGSKLRPWIIPVGLDINVLGVPSNAVSVLNAGMNFGAGVDYEIWRGIVIGSDLRYHYSTSHLDGTPTDGLNAGGYVGFKF